MDLAISSQLLVAKLEPILNHNTACGTNSLSVGDMAHLEGLVTGHNGLIGVGPALRGEVHTTESRYKEF